MEQTKTNRANDTYMNDYNQSFLATECDSASEKRRRAMINENRVQYEEGSDLREFYRDNQRQLFRQ